MHDANDRFYSLGIYPAFVGLIPSAHWVQIRSWRSPSSWWKSCSKNRKIKKTGSQGISLLDVCNLNDDETEPFLTKKLLLSRPSRYRTIQNIIQRNGYINILIACMPTWCKQIFFIHPKKDNVYGIQFFSPKKSAETVRTFWQQNFATWLRKS